MKNKKTNSIKWCEDKRACSSAIEWIKDNKINSLEEAWGKCKRSDWMLWSLAEIDHKNDSQLRLFACWCVRQVWHLLDDERSKNAIIVAEKYAIGKATDSELAIATKAAAEKDVWDATRAVRAVMWAAWDAVGGTTRTARDASWETMRAAVNVARATQDAADVRMGITLSEQADKLREMIENPFIGV